MGRLRNAGHRESIGYPRCTPIDEAICLQENEFETNVSDVGGEKKGVDLENG